MKIKIDFVTNSSSTSFILTSVLTGYLPEIENCKFIKNLFPMLQGFVYDDHASICTPDNKKDEEKLKSNIYLTTEPIYDDIKKDLYKKRTILEIKISNPYIVNEENRHINLQLSIEYIEKILTMVPKTNTHLIYFQYPDEMTSGGWNGGDPMGIYSSTPDCYRNEIKTGTVYIVNNRVNSELLDFGQEASILDEVYKLIENAEEKSEN